MWNSPCFLVNSNASNLEAGTTSEEADAMTTAATSTSAPPNIIIKKCFVELDPTTKETATSSNVLTTSKVLTTTKKPFDDSLTTEGDAGDELENLEVGQNKGVKMQNTESPSGMGGKSITSVTNLFALSQF